MSAGAAPAPATDYEVRLARTEAGLAALGQDVRDLVGAVRGIADKIDADRSSFASELSKRDKTNWALVVSIVVASMGGMAFIGSGWREPLVQRQDAIATQVAALQQAVVPRAEVTSLMTQAQRDNDLIRQRIERTEARNEKRLDRLEGMTFVPAWTATTRRRS
ncbi:hypothetical protein A3862_04215 [Methylobacterium sp. XJLW]|uniref:hypothetical protein n=1 Tax=Methylobacterium sp. XJLW TaxID=739141 RepID=UPI000DAAE844|nr:hypothetical protein [Methylobacterium sp. XJLW]AWV14804.1 hypothetical protein A3862_04215 [Methylobacterium sp. XJLW]